MWTQSPTIFSGISLSSTTGAGNYKVVLGRRGRYKVSLPSSDLSTKHCFARCRVLASQESSFHNIRAEIADSMENADEGDDYLESGLRH
ncbi:hypothetical protein J6590_011327 [Homalodisca vitripennis]|nr:hypothetical protein J6590_011327 [Homalodisca vitripennis]